MDISALSSLVIVPVASLSAMVTPDSAGELVAIVTVKLSSGSTTSSSTVWTVIVVVAPGSELVAKDTIPDIVAV